MLGDRAAALAGLDRGGVAILPRAVADRTGLTVGSTLSLALGGGKVADLRVAGIVERSLPGSTGEAILVGWPDATGVFGVEGADALAVRYEPGAEATARPAVEALARESALEPSPLETVAGAIDSALGQVFGLFDALAVIAVLVAALGIVNTLTVGVLERVREIGVLRASGMTRTQVRRTVVVEAGILGIVGAVLGIATGLVAGRPARGLGRGGPADPRGPVAVDPRRRRPRRGRLDARGLVSGPSGEPSRDRQRRPSRIGPLRILGLPRGGPASGAGP